MSENSLLEYFRNSGFEDLILPNMPQEILNIFSLAQVKESYDKVLQGKKPVPPEGGEVPELNFKEDLQMLEDAVKKAQEASGLDDEQMKEAFKGLLEEKLGGGASENPEEKLTFSEHKNANIIKNASAGNWVIDYFYQYYQLEKKLLLWFI